MTIAGAMRRLRRAHARAPEIAVERLGIAPRWVGYRYLRSEYVSDYLTRIGPVAGDRFRRIHPEELKRNPLPKNVPIRDLLPDRVGWWGYSFRDVPERTSQETFVATLPDCRVLHYVDPANQQFYPVIVGRDDRQLLLRETRFRPPHIPFMRGARRVQRLDRAVWFLERVYHNYSHWLTAHVPKLILLQREQLLDGLVLPEMTNPVIEESLDLLGINQERCHRLVPGSVLQADELTLIGSDRFRPELLRSVRETFARPADRSYRRVFVSRARATRRRLLNEEEVWAVLEGAGFERVLMEDLSFADQIQLMGETKVLFAPHGAGLTNMIFCSPGTHVAEIADLSFPNPNFYATASALGHHYWLLSGRPVGDQHPLHRDMRAVVGEVEHVVDSLLMQLSASSKGSDDTLEVAAP